ncbi:MAG: hypothetical protein B7O98_04055 [Zestosphaera tikiterensis]|uniref:Glycosyltransferase 2-like domain-containing protein n=1 Tax=Zestosphaera tikiterensis TaxID=1973259 RepID=A0A2R7Y7U6_9CREN|nr:MAG: hypothetical protein B7O98_04055 [Zestosphaera tikiterensis]
MDVTYLLRVAAYALIFGPGIAVMLTHSLIYLTSRARHNALREVGVDVSRKAIDGLTVLIPIKGEPEEVVLELVENVASAVRGLSRDYEVMIVSDDPYDEIINVKDRVEGLARKLGLKNFNFIIRTEGAKGRSGALSWGVLKARYEAVLIIDVDTRLETGALDKVVKCLELGYDFCVCRWVGYTYRKTKLGVVLSKSMKYVVDVLYEGRSRLGLPIYPLGSGTAFKKEVLLKVGLWDPNVVQDDMHIGTKLFKVGTTSAFLNDALIKVSVPSSFNAFRIQQGRWAYGAMEALRKGYRNILSSKYGFKVKLELMLFLCQYVPLTTIALSTLLIPLLTLSLRTDFLKPDLLTASFFTIPLALYGFSMYSSTKDLSAGRLRALRSLGSAAAFTAAISFTTLIYTLMGLTTNKFKYVVTPKGSKESVKSNFTFELIILTYLTIVGFVSVFYGYIYTGLWLWVLALGLLYTIINAEKIVK